MLNVYGSLLRTTDLATKDQFGNDTEASNRYTLLGGFGYAQSLEDLPCTAGIGFFAQGGSGGIFKNLNTAFGTKDEFSALFSIAKFTPGIGCKINDALSIGGSFGLVYAQANEKIFPDTLGAGLELKNMSSLRTSLKLGVQYKVSPDLTLAATFTEKTELPLSGGKLRLKTGANSYATYQDVKLTGLALPREIGLGTAYQASDDVLLSIKLNWINWADAFIDNQLTASNPNAPAPQVLRLNGTSNWHNQWVIAAGTAYRYDDKTTLYAGYNYGKNPILQAHTTPLIAGIFEHHITLGGAYQYSPLWKFAGGIEYDANKKVDYTNLELPFGANSQLRNEAIFLHFMASRKW